LCTDRNEKCAEMFKYTHVLGVNHTKNGIQAIMTAEKRIQLDIILRKKSELYQILHEAIVVSDTGMLKKTGPSEVEAHFGRRQGN